MKRYILILVLAMVLGVAHSSETPNQKLISNATEHFANGEWKESSSLFQIVVSEHSDKIIFYAPAIVSAAKTDNYDLVMSYVVTSEKRGLAIDSILDNTLTLTIKIKDVAIYEKMLLRIKKEQPWLHNKIDMRLLNFYYDRHMNKEAIEMANSIIAKSPKNVIDLMLVKAKSYNELGEVDSAVVVMRDIVIIDEKVVDARLFLGNYYYLSAKESIKEGKFTVKVPAKKGKKSSFAKYSNTNIYSALKRAKMFLDADFLTEKRPYVQSLISDIDAMIDAFEEPIEEENFRREK